MADAKLLDQVRVAAHQWSRRHNRIKDWRDIRYGRDDVLSTIPEELRATDFEYHSMDLDEAVHDLSAFMSGAQQTWNVNPSKDRDMRRSDDIESVLAAIFGPNGVLESEAGGEVNYMVWQNQVEPAGQGIYKLTLKRDYPLRMPQRVYVDDQPDPQTDAGQYEPNADYKPTSKRKRDSKDQTRYRETDAALAARRDAFMEDEFPWQWRSVDPIHYFEITKDGVPVIQGEITARSVSRLDESERATLGSLEKGFTYLSEPGSDGNSSEVVNCIEYWTDTHGYFCFMEAEAKSNSDRKVEESRSWSHPYGRPPYYHANGLMTNDKDIGLRYSGAFTKLLSEVPLLNHLETMHFNAVHRGYFPMYYPVKDAAQSMSAPMEAEQLVAVTQADMERTELPPGWKWEVMPSGFEPDLMGQLQGARERVKDSAIAAVLAGRAGGSGDSGAKISLLINAATRNIDPFRRHHEGAYKAMAQTLLTCSKKLKLDLHVSIETQTEEGSRLVKALTVRATDIVSTSVEMQLNVKLPVDEAAGETRGLTLVQTGMRSYQTAAPIFFGVGDPTKEKERIAIEKRETQIDDIAFQQAAVNFGQVAPAYFQEFMGNVEPLAPGANTVGGGPQGSYGGASAMMGRGSAALPAAAQVDTGGATG